MIDGRTKKIIPDSEFNSLIQPVFDAEKCEELGLDPPCQEAYDITGQTEEMLKKAPPLKLVWGNFTDYVNRYSSGKSKWDSVILCGFNSDGYDAEIIRRIAGCKPWAFGPFDKEFRECTLFHPARRIDIMQDIGRWLAHDKSVFSISMDSMRKYFGISNEGAHNALVDVKQGAAILEKFLALYDHLGPKIKFKDCFTSGE